MATLDEIIESVLKRDGSTRTGETLIVANHLAQMRLFGIRRGVEFYPNQDDGRDNRFKFIQSLHKANKIDLYLDRYWDLLLCKGRLLFYLRPTGSTYRIYHYNQDEFRAYYDGDGDLTEVIIIYSYKIKSELSQKQVKWLKLRITTEKIYRSESDSQPSFEGLDNMAWGRNEEETENTLSFIPCIVVNNYTIGPGQDGIGEFDWLKDQIESHDNMVYSQTKNLEFFGSPTLVSTRSASELTEAGVDGDSNHTRPTLSSNGGWYGSTGSSRKSDPFERGRGGVRVKRVIGNVQADERFGYVAPDPTSPDHSRHIADTRESIHYALGGIDELGLHTQATAYEMKTVYGKVAATAAKKCLHLYDHGLCKVFELAIAAEEKVFKDTLAVALKADPASVSDEMCRELAEKGKIPKGVFGMLPMGDRTIRWRHTGPVFEDSPQDVLQKSIVVRNLQELGVQSLEGLKFLFPDRTEKELLNVLSGGFPFRYVQAIASSTGQLMNLFQQSLSLPNPAMQGQPLAASANFAPLIIGSVETLYKELNHGKQFDPTDPNSDPTKPIWTSPSDDRPAAVGNAELAVAERGNAPQLPVGGSLAAAGIFPPQSQPGNGQQPVEGGVQQRGGVPEYTRPLPVPGGTVNTPTSTTTGLPELQQWSSLPKQPGIPSDLAVGSNVLQQLFPTVTAAAKRLRGKRK